MNDVTGTWLLAIDTSTEQASIALFNGYSVADLSWPAGRDQTVSVLDEIDHLLTLNKLTISGLAAVAVATGPGMFNGLRVGMSIAKGLAFSASLPLIGVPTLDAVAQPHDACGLPIVAVLQAGRGRLIWSKYWAGTSSEPRNGTASELAQEIVQAGEMVLLCGEVSQEVRVEVAQSLHARIGWPLSGMRRAASVAYLGWLRFRLGRFDDSVALEPTYLHAASPISKP